MTQPAPRTGAQILADQLARQGVQHVFCVPGESYLSALDALRDSDIALTVCRAEGGASMMAEAAGKLTGRPGICFVTRGPGATNAAPGVHIAQQDSTPMILFVGQVGRGYKERDAFQELDYRAVFGSMAKWVVDVDDARRLPEFIARAFRVAMQGRPGPVVVALPEDMLTETATVGDAPYVTPATAAPAPDDLAHLADLLAGARAPLAIIGGSAWDEDGANAFRRFAEAWDLPVATSLRRAYLFPAAHRNYAGDLGIGPNPKLAARVREADLLLLIGGRMSEMVSSYYKLLDIPVPRQKLVHVHPGPEELGRVYQPTLGILATPAAFARAVETLTPAAPPPWSNETAAANADYLAWTTAPRTLPGDFQYGEVVRWLQTRLPDNTITTAGAGNYTGWVHRHLCARGYGSQLAPISGSMGYSLPAAVAAKRLHPERLVLAFAGDGCFLMNGQDFATAVQYDLPIIVVLVDNGQYGTIRMHQEQKYPGRVVATQLRNPDFAAYASAFGGHGETVLTTADFAPAFERALAAGLPAIIHCKLDPRAISHARDIPG